MKKKYICIFVFILFSICIFGTSELNSAEIKKIEKSKVISAQKPQNIYLLKPEIGMILQDVFAGQIIEVNGNHFGETQGTRKIFLGQKEGDVKTWFNNYIGLRFPASPVLGKKLPFYIKNGNVIISNTAYKTLYVFIMSATPNRILSNNLSAPVVEISATWCGTDKNNIKVRFDKKAIMTLPVTRKKNSIYGKILSITPGGSTHTIKVKLPPSIPAGTYLVKITQNRRVVSQGDPITIIVTRRILRR